MSSRSTRRRPAKGGGPIPACPICITRYSYRIATIDGRCQICYVEAIRWLAGIRSAASRWTKPARPGPVAPLLLWPIPPVEAVNAKLNDWIATQKETHTHA